MTHRVEEEERQRGRVRERESGGAWEMKRKTMCGRRGRNLELT